MYQATEKYTNQKTNCGFTLVELLVAITIIGIISVISVQGLYDIITIRAKQQTIEDSSDSFRSLTRLVTKSVIEAKNVSVPSDNVLETEGENECQTFVYSSETKAILRAVDEVDAEGECSPPDILDGDFESITNDDLEITVFSLSPPETRAQYVTLQIEGSYKNSLGDHPLKYSTTITKRVRVDL